MKWLDYRENHPLRYNRDRFPCLSEDFVVTLNESEKHNLLTLAEKIFYNPYLSIEKESFIEKSKGLISALEADTLNKINNILNRTFGAVLIKNLPLEKNLPDTPKKGGSLTPDFKSSFISEAFLIAIGCISGAEPFNFRQEGRGSAPLIDNIVPVLELKEQKGSGGYKNNFPFHCESAWNPRRPDYLVLLGLRENSDAKTLIFSSSQLKFENVLLNEITSNNECFRLKAPELYIQMQEKGIGLGTEEYTYKPPLEILDNILKLNINFNGTECSNVSALSTLNKLERFIEDNCASVILKPGSALIMNNDLVCHTRTGYVPKFDGNDRWFLRAYFIKKLNLTRQEKESLANRLFQKSEIDDLRDKGWLDENYNLTNNFNIYIREPERITTLSDSDKYLASLAFFFTPYINERII